MKHNRKSNEIPPIKLYYDSVDQAKKKKSISLGFCQVCNINKSWVGEALLGALYLIFTSVHRRKVIVMSHCIILGDWKYLELSLAHIHFKGSGSEPPQHFSASYAHCWVTEQNSSAYFPSHTVHSFLTIFSISTFKSAQTSSERFGIFVCAKYNSVRNARECTARRDGDGEGGEKRQEEDATPVMLSIALYIRALTSHRPCPKQEWWRGN